MRLHGICQQGCHLLCQGHKIQLELHLIVGKNLDTLQMKGKIGILRRKNVAGKLLALRARRLTI